MRARSHEGMVFDRLRGALERRYRYVENEFLVICEPGSGCSSFADTKDHDENGTDATRPVRKDLVDITKCCNFNSRCARYDARLPLLFNVKGCRLGWQAVENAAMSPIKSDPKFPNDMIFSVGVELSKLPNPFLRVFASLAAPAVDLIDGRTVGEWTETIRKSLKGRFLVNVGKHTFDSAVLAEEMDLEEGEEVDLVGGESTPLEERHGL